MHAPTPPSNLPAKVHEPAGSSGAAGQGGGGRIKTNRSTNQSFESSDKQKQRRGDADESSRLSAAEIFNLTLLSSVLNVFLS